MWIEITKDTKDLERIASIRNMYDCAVNYNAANIIHSIKNKVDCHFYYYKDEDYEILIGIKIHRGFKKATYTSYAIGKFGSLSYYKKALRIIAKKTREYLVERNINLIGQTKGMGENNKTMAYLGGLAPFLETAKIEYEKCGIRLDIDYENDFFEMSVIPIDDR